MRVFRKARILLLVVVLFSFAGVLFAQETTTTVTTRKSNPWTFNGSMSLTFSINPWLLGDDFNSVARGLNIGVDTVLSYGYVGLLFGYQFMGLVDSLSGNDGLYYGSHYGVDVFASFKRQQHMLTFMPMFTWPRGIVRPYAGAGLAILMDVNTYTVGVVSVAGLSYSDTLVQIGVGSQAGVNFVFKKLLLGVGINMLVPDLDMIDEVNMSTAEVMRKATYFVTRVGFTF